MGFFRLKYLIFSAAVAFLVFFSAVYAQNPGDPAADTEGTAKIEDTSVAVPAGNEKPAAEPADTEKGSAEPAEKAEREKSVKKIETGAAKKVAETAGSKGPAATEPAKAEEVQRPRGMINGLLQITEGNYKYSRIPEIKLPAESTAEYKEEDQPSEEIIVSEEIDIPEENGADSEKSTGIFGVEKKTGDTIVIVVLLLIIVAIIILLKAKSKERGDGVLRRFPRA